MVDTTQYLGSVASYHTEVLIATYRGIGRVLPRYWSHPSEVLSATLPLFNEELSTYPYSARRCTLQREARYPTARDAVPYSARNRLTRKEHPKKPRKELGRYRCASSDAFRWFHDVFTQCSHDFVNIGPKYNRKKKKNISFFLLSILHQFPIFTIFTREHTNTDPSVQVGL